MEASLIKGHKDFQKVVNIHFGGSTLSLPSGLQNLHNPSLTIKRLHQADIIQGAVSLVVLLQHLKDTRGLEIGRDSLVLAKEQDTNETVPFIKVDGWRRDDGFHPDNAAFNLWRRPKAIFADLHNVNDLGQELDVHREATVQVITGTGYQTHGKLTLEHENGRPEEWSLLQQLKSKRRRNLVRSIGDADVKVGQLSLQKVTNDDVKLFLLGSPLDTLDQFSCHSGILFDNVHLLSTFQELHSQVTGTRTDFEHDIRRLDVGLREEIRIHHKVQ